MSFNAGNTGSASTAIDGIVGKGQLGNNETISTTRLLTDADRRVQVFTPSGAIRIVQLPTTLIVAGEAWDISCSSTAGFALTVQSSNGTALSTLNPGESLRYVSKVATPVASTDWSILASPSNASGGINEQPTRNYLKTYSSADSSPGVLSTLASTTSNLVSLTAFYADSTSGSAALSTSASTALRGSNNYLTATGTSDSTGARFIQFPATVLDGSDLGKPISILFDVTGVTTDGNWDVVVVRYNASGVHQSIISVAGNASTATPASAKLPTGNTTFNGFFIPDSTTATDLYAVRLRSLANTVQIRLDTLFAGPQPIRVGAPVTDWQSFTPVYSTGTPGTNTTTAMWRRVGDSMEIQYSFIQTATTGAANGSAAYLITIPGGYQADTNKIDTTGSINDVGGSYAYNGTTEVSGFTRVFSSTQLNVLFQNGASAYSSWASGYFNFAGTATLRVTFFARIPIVGWSSNVTMADRALEETVWNSSTTDANDTTSFGYGSGGVQFGSFSTANRTKRVRFTTPIQATDALILEIFDTNGWIAAGNSLVSSLSATTGMCYTAVTGSATDVDVTFGSAGFAATVRTTAAAWSVIAASPNFKWRVRKVSSGAQVGYPIEQSNLTHASVGNGMFYEEGSFTGTLTGLTTSPTSTIYFARVGKQVTITISGQTTGTSNTTALTVTGMPTRLAPARDQWNFARSINNGSGQPGVVVVNASTGVFTFYIDVNANVYTASGTKGISNTVFTYSMV